MNTRWRVSDEPDGWVIDMGPDPCPLAGDTLRLDVFDQGGRPILIDLDDRPVTIRDSKGDRKFWFRKVDKGYKLLPVEGG